MKSLRFDHLGFQVADLNKTLAAMRKANVTISDEPIKFDVVTTIAFIETKTEPSSS